MIKVPGALPATCSRVAFAPSSTVCKRLASTAPQTSKYPDEFSTADQMLRPKAPRAVPAVVAYRYKHFHESRYRNYDFDFDFKNTNSGVRGDRMPHTADVSWIYRLTTMRGHPSTRTELGDKKVAEAREKITKGEKPDAKWISKAMYDAGNPAQLAELYKIAQELNVVDSKLLSSFIYNVAKKGAPKEAVEIYEQTKSERGVTMDADIHASGIEAYAKSGEGKKAMELYESLTKGMGLEKTPLRAHSTAMAYYFENGEMRKGFAIFEALDKAKVKLDVGVITSLIRGYRLSGSAKEAQAAFDRLKAEGLTPDSHAHAELVISYGKAGKDIANMMKKLQEMKDSGFRPNNILYNAVIRVMLGAGEMDNALMALDMQFKERAWPLDKNCVIMLARHYARQEQAEKVKEKTEYAIWIGRKSGLYVEDLTYLTKVHYMYLDEYYFRHHPEYDYPDALRKPYQYKDWDEHAIYYPEDDRRPGAQRLANFRASPHRSYLSGLPSFSEPLREEAVMGTRFRVPAPEEILAEDARAQAAAQGQAPNALTPERKRLLVQEARYSRAVQTLRALLPHRLDEHVLSGLDIDHLRKLRAEAERMRTQALPPQRPKKGEFLARTPAEKVAVERAQKDIDRMRADGDPTERLISVQVRREHALADVEKQIDAHIHQRKSKKKIEAVNAYDLEEAPAFLSMDTSFLLKHPELRLLREEIDYDMKEISSNPSAAAEAEPTPVRAEAEISMEEAVAKLETEAKKEEKHEEEEKEPEEVIELEEEEGPKGRRV